MIKKIAQRLMILIVLGGAIGGYYYYTISRSAVDETLYYGEVALETYDVFATASGIIDGIEVSVGQQVISEEKVMVLNSDLAQLQYDRSLLGQSVAAEQVVKGETGAGETSLNMQSYSIEQLESQKDALEATINANWQLHKQSIINSNTYYASYELNLEIYENLLALYEGQLETKANLDQGALAVTNSKNTYDSSLLTTKRISNEIAALQSQVGAIVSQIGSAEEGLKQLSDGYEASDKTIVELGQEQAEIDVAAYAYNLDQYMIKAYKAGIVDDIYYNTGEFVNVGSTVMTLHNPEVMEVSIYVSEKDLLKITLGQEMNFHLVVDPSIEMSGHVENIAREAMFTPVNIVTETDRERLVFEVEIKLEGNDRVKSGMLLVTDISELE